MQLLAGELWPRRKGVSREVHAGWVLVRLQCGVVRGAGRVCRVGGSMSVRLQSGGLSCGHTGSIGLFLQLSRSQLWLYVASLQHSQRSHSIQCIVLPLLLYYIINYIIKVGQLQESGNCQCDCSNVSCGLGKVSTALQFNSSIFTTTLEMTSPIVVLRFSFQNNKTNDRCTRRNAVVTVEELFVV